MVGLKPAAMVADDNEKIDTQALIRLAIWGVCAVVSVVVAVFAAHTELGSKRLSAGLMAIASPPAEPQTAAISNLLARTAAAEREARRATETVVAISADRERVMSRVNAMEREIGDINGSVGRAIAIATEGKAVPPVLTMSSAGVLNAHKSVAPTGWTVPVPQAAAEPSPAGRDMAVHPDPLPPAKAQPEPSPAQAQVAIPPRPAGPITVQASAPPAAIAATPPQAVPAARPSPAVAVAAARPDDTAPQSTGSTGANTSSDLTPKVEFGVDLGPATTVGRLRSRWNKLASERPELFKGLRPVVAFRDTGAGKPVEVRLVAGPLATVNAATEFCTALGTPPSIPYVCRPSVFDGQRLNVQ